MGYKRAACAAWQLAFSFLIPERIQDPGSWAGLGDQHPGWGPALPVPGFLLQSWSPLGDLVFVVGHPGTSTEAGIQAWSRVCGKSRPEDKGSAMDTHL